MRLSPFSCVRLAIFLAVVVAGPAGAITLGFGCVSNNSASNCDAGEAQVRVDVTDPGGNQIAFTFRNAGPAASSIADVYWDDDAGVLAGLFSITNTPGLVEFSEGARPGNLPAGNDALPPFAADFSADSDAPPQPNGVNPGEQLVVIFDLLPGKAFADAVAALTDGSLRVGVHVQGFVGGGSESFVNTPVPEPATLAVVAGGLLSLAVTQRRRR